MPIQEDKMSSVPKTQAQPAPRPIAPSAGETVHRAARSLQDDPAPPNVSTDAVSGFVSDLEACASSRQLETVHVPMPGRPVERASHNVQAKPVGPNNQRNESRPVDQSTRTKVSRKVEFTFVETTTREIASPKPDESSTHSCQLEIDNLIESPRLAPFKIAAHLADPTKIFSDIFKKLSASDGKKKPSEFAPPPILRRKNSAVDRLTEALAAVRPSEPTYDDNRFWGRIRAETLSSDLGEVINISASGICVRVKGKQQHEHNSVIEFTLQHVNSKSGLRLTGRVAWTKNI